MISMYTNKHTYIIEDIKTKKCYNNVFMNTKCSKYFSLMDKGTKKVGVILFLFFTSFLHLIRDEMVTMSLISV